MSTILLVEDNELNRDMLSRRLERKGYRVVTAVDGRQAIDSAIALQPDLILMDMRLPEISGWDAVKELRAKPESRAIPIVALTADALEEDRSRALEFGCNAFATKPVDFAALLEIIEALLGEKTVESARSAGNL